MKPLFNEQEKRAFDELKSAADEYGLVVYPKVGLKDVLPIENSGISPELYNYSLKAHFDFVVYGEDQRPRFAVEFDGPAHEEPAQRARDQKKNRLCKRFGLPLLRTVASHISRKYRDLTILRWIIEVYQLQIAFDDAQSKGYLPCDEPFDPFFILHSGKKKFPYWISLEARLALQKFHKQGLIAAPCTSGFIGYDDDDVMRGIEYIQITETDGISVESAMRPQDFPVLLSDLLDELLSIFLHEKLERYFSGGEVLRPLSEIYARANDMKSRLKLARAHGYGIAERLSVDQR